MFVGVPQLLSLLFLQLEVCVLCLLLAVLFCFCFLLLFFSVLPLLLHGAGGMRALFVC